MLQNSYDHFEEKWNALSKEDQLAYFYAVCSRIHKGDLVENGTYRYVLYDVFGFGPEAYAVGMFCGYFDMHNAFYRDEEWA